MRLPAFIVASLFAITPFYALGAGAEADDSNSDIVTRYLDARRWSATKEYIDIMSGAKDRRPGLDDLVRDARRRQFDAVVVWKLDRSVVRSVIWFC